MMRSLFLRITLILIVLFGLTLSHVHAQTATTILLFGDSIVAGYNLSKKDSLAVQLERSLQDEGYDVKVINGGVSGDTTRSGLSRLEWTLEKHQPDIVLLALGGNDVLRGVSPNATKENLDLMLSILREKKLHIVFSAVQAPLNLGVHYQKEFNSVYTGLADKYDVTLYPFLLKRTFGNKAFMQNDQIHPNAEGVKVIANDLTQNIIEILMENPPIK